MKRVGQVSRGQELVDQEVHSQVQGRADLPALEEISLTQTSS